MNAGTAKGMTSSAMTVAACFRRVMEVSYEGGTGAPRAGRRSREGVGICPVMKPCAASGVCGVAAMKAVGRSAVRLRRWILGGGRRRQESERALRTSREAGWENPWAGSRRHVGGRRPCGRGRRDPMVDAPHLHVARLIHAATWIAGPFSVLARSPLSVARAIRNELVRTREHVDTTHEMRGARLGCHVNRFRSISSGLANSITATLGGVSRTR